MSGNSTKKVKRVVKKEANAHKKEMIEGFMTIVMTQRLWVRIKFAWSVIRAKQLKEE